MARNVKPHRPRCHHSNRLRIAGRCYGCQVERLRARLEIADEHCGEAAQVIDRLLWVIEADGHGAIWEVQDQAERLKAELRDHLGE